jgi:hypothetical protein
LSHDGQNLQIDSIELIDSEATPATGLTETFVDLRRISRVHLIGAVCSTANETTQQNENDEFRGVSCSLRHHRPNAVLVPVLSCVRY